MQAHGVKSLDEYLRVSRVGRGSRLNRAARARAWRVFEEYRTQLAERGLKEVDDAYRDAAVLLQNDPEALDYAAVIVDEGQDMGAQAYRLLRAVVPAGPNDVFVRRATATSVSTGGTRWCSAAAESTSAAVRGSCA